MTSSSMTDVAGPAWPDTDGRRVLFFIDANSRLERSLLRGWVAANRPADTPRHRVTVASIPKARRHRSGDWRINPHLVELLDQGDDQLAVPLRVVWRAPKRDGERTVSWKELLRLGDPRDPDWLRQYWFMRTAPGRCLIVAGEPATIGELRRRWEEDFAATDDFTFAEYASLQGSLALERAERRVRGSRYKVPRFVADDILWRRRSQSRIRAVADEIGCSAQEATARSRRYLKEIAANHSPYVIDLVANAIRLILRGAYRLEYDRDELHRVAELGQRQPLVFLPSHKSMLDRLALQLALYENGLPPNHTAGGINLNFFPVGTLIRRSGVFFIRRSFRDKPLYKLTLKLYIAYLVEKRFSLEWYLEGGRSRSGKLRPPKFGMLGYVYDAWRGGASDDVMLIPVSIAYDEIHDVGEYTREQRGEAKDGESIGYVVRFYRALRRDHGAIYLRFGEPLSLAAEAARGDETAEGRALAVKKIAFEVSVRINDVTPITPISLVTLALLDSGGRALSVEQTMYALEPYLDYVKARELPTTDALQLDTPERVRTDLDHLVAAGVVSRHSGGLEVVYAIEPDQHIAAAYYRNTIIHFFVNGAIAELAMLRAAQPGVTDPEAEFEEQARRLRDLLKFEFFFPKREPFQEDLRGELDLQDPAWRAQLDAGDATALLRAFRPYKSHTVLRPYLEAYRVVADVLVRSDAAEPIDHKAFIAEALALGSQYHLQRRIHSAESVSSELFKTALQLAANRKLTEPGPDIDERRQEFADEIRETLHDIDAIEALEAGT